MGMWIVKPLVGWTRQKKNQACSRKQVDSCGCFIATKLQNKNFRVYKLHVIFVSFTYFTFVGHNRDGQRLRVRLERLSLPTTSKMNARELEIRDWRV